jgi:hypothetical protein
MNKGYFFHTQTPGLLDASRRFVASIKAGCLKALRVFSRGGAMSTELELAANKRELENTLLAQGFSRRLAKIAVASAFRHDRANHT